MDIHKILADAANLKIAVIGDLIEDRYVIGDVNRISPEAPIPVLEHIKNHRTLGGAGNVFMNLRNIGVQVDLFCNAQMSWSEGLFELLENIFVYNYPHAVKTRFMCGNQQLLRVDKELPYDQIEWQPYATFPWWKTLQEKFGQYDCIVLSDYHKGVLSDSLINAIMELAKHYSIPVVVDAKKDFNRYKGAYIIKCNSKEATHLNKSGYVDSNKNDYWVVTLGAKGISLYYPEGGEGYEGFPTQVVDVCGAGDTVTAIMALTKIGIGASCELANVAASEVCRHPGVYAITKEDLIRRFNETEK